MDKYLGRCGQLVKKESDRCHLQFDDDSKFWWGFGALEVPATGGLCITLDITWEYKEGQQWRTFDRHADGC